jgi:hypothetical protein
MGQGIAMLKDFNGLICNTDGAKIAKSRAYVEA